MSINACTINTVTINGFCGTVRAKVYARLVQEKNGTVQPTIPPIPGGGGWAGGLGPGSFYVPRHNPIPFDHTPGEQPFITVTADLFGTKGQETLNSKTNQEFVTVRNLDIGDEDSIDISMISVKNLVIDEPSEDEDITVNIRGLEIE